MLVYTKRAKRVHVNAYYTHPLPEECILNGVILDNTPVIDGLNALKSAHPQSFRNVSLILDGSFVYTKKITLPGKLDRRMYDKVIRGEFSEVASDIENLICDHFALASNADGSKEILACGVENSHVTEYLSIFETADIKLTAIDLGILALLNHISSEPKLQRTPFVLNVVDDVIMLSMIFQNGVSVFQSRTRLFGDDHTSLLQSTLTNLSGIIQFNRSQNFDDITHCFYLGLSHADIMLIAQGSEYPDIQFGLFDLYNNSINAERLPPDAHLAYLSACMPANAPDLLNSIKTLDKTKRQQRPKNKFIPIAACVFLIIAATLAFFAVRIFMIERDVHELENFLYDPDMVAERIELSTLLSDTERINELYISVAMEQYARANVPQISRDIIETVIRTGGNSITVTGFSFNSAIGELSVTAQSTTELYAAQYVASLTENPLIYSVHYIGYSTGAAGEFVFTIGVVATDWRGGGTQ